MIRTNVAPVRLEFKHYETRPITASFRYYAEQRLFGFHPWVRKQNMRSPEGDGEDRLLEDELRYYRDLWWAHVAKINHLKGRDPLEAAMAGARKD